MRRYDFDYVNDDTDRREAIERKHGDWVEAYDAFRAIAEERRQTQRRMIAALYWRAGALSERGYIVPAVHVAGVAEVMEAAL